MYGLEKPLMEENGGISASPADSFSESFWTSERTELLSWLGDRAPSFVEGYKSAVCLLYTPEFPARIHLICHIVRDIYRYLPSAMGTKTTPRAGEVFPNMVNKLRTLWNDNPPIESRRSDHEGIDLQMSVQLHSYLQKIVKTSNDFEKTKTTVGKQLAIVLYQSMDRQQEDYIPPWVIDSFDAEYDFFVERAHLARSMNKVPDEDGLSKHFQSFEKSFHALVGPYFSGKGDLDDILQDTNTASD